MKLLAGILGVAVAVLLVIGGERERRIGRIQGAIADDVRVAKAERARGDTLALRFLADSARFSALARRQPRIVKDTLWLPGDSIPYPVDRPVPGPVVREVVAQADTTIRACRAAVMTCAEGWAASRRENTALLAETVNLRKLIPSKPGLWLRCATGAGLGAAGGGALSGGKSGAFWAAGGALAGCLLVTR